MDWKPQKEIMTLSKTDPQKNIEKPLLAWPHAPVQTYDASVLSVLTYPIYEPLS